MLTVCGLSLSLSAVFTMVGSDSAMAVPERSSELVVSDLSKSLARVGLHLDWALVGS